MSQTKTPPWVRKYETLTRLEMAIVDVCYDRGLTRGNAAWSELCALQAVAEAAEQKMSGTDQDDDALSAAIKEWRAICPRNVV